MATPPTSARNCGNCGRKIVSRRKTCSEECQRRLQGYTREAKENPDAIQDPGDPLDGDESAARARKILDNLRGRMTARMRKC